VGIIYVDLRAIEPTSEKSAPERLGEYRRPVLPRGTLDGPVRGEVRELLVPLGKALVRMPTWPQLSVSTMITFSTFVLLYGLYSLSFG